jgi:hypothetical protein
MAERQRITPDTYCTLCDTNQRMRPEMIRIIWMGDVLCLDCCDELNEIIAEGIDSPAEREE